MNIQKFAERVGISAYTLRYYEKIGLLRDVVRLNNGHRCFSEQDVGWIMFIQRLKETGMPLAQIQDYADARVLGDITLGARKILLEKHAQQLQENLIKQQQHLHKLNEKIAYYQVAIEQFEKAQNVALTINSQS